MPRGARARLPGALHALCGKELDGVPVFQQVVPGRRGRPISKRPASVASTRVAEGRGRGRSPQPSFAVTKARLRGAVAAARVAGAARRLASRRPARTRTRRRSPRSRPFQARLRSARCRSIGAGCRGSRTIWGPWSRGCWTCARARFLLVRRASRTRGRGPFELGDEERAVVVVLVARELRDAHQIRPPVFLDRRKLRATRVEARRGSARRGASGLRAAASRAGESARRGSDATPIPAPPARPVLDQIVLVILFLEHHHVGGPVVVPAEITH